LPDGTLNPDLPAIFQKRNTLNALWLKLSLGHFSDTQPLDALRTLLNRAAWRWWWKTIRPTAASWRRCSASRPPVG
jgi:hypothetical protein